MSVLYECINTVVLGIPEHAPSIEVSFPRHCIFRFTDLPALALRAKTPRLRRLPGPKSQVPWIACTQQRYQDQSEGRISAQV